MEDLIRFSDQMFEKGGKYDFVRVTSAYYKYKEWCVNNKITMVNSRRFKYEMERILPMPYESKGWRGIRIIL